MKSLRTETILTGALIIMVVPLVGGYLLSRQVTWSPGSDTERSKNSSGDVVHFDEPEYRRNPDAAPDAGTEHDKTRSGHESSEQLPGDRPEWTPSYTKKFTASYVKNVARETWFQNRVRTLLENGTLKDHLRNLSKDRLWKQITKRSNITKEDLADSADPYELGRDLVDASLTKRSEAESENEQKLQRPVVFSTDVNEATHEAVNSREVFSTDTDRIYVVFKMGRFRGILNIFIKWTYRPTGEILLYEKKPIDAGKHWNYVWLKMKKGWRPGPYDVTLYRIEKGTGDLKYFGSGAYRIR